MADGAAELERMLEKLRTLPQLLTESLQDVAGVVRDELERTITAGTTPEGVPWKEREAGGRALVDAGKALRVAVVGTRVFVKIDKHYARHSLGRARGGVARRILPSKGIPRAMADEIRETLGARFRAHMGGT